MAVCPQPELEPRLAMPHPLLLALQTRIIFAEKPWMLWEQERR
jgi:hypothetical protein